MTLARLPFDAMQVQILARLKNNLVDLNSATVPVYDDVPENADWGYIKFGTYTSVSERHKGFGGTIWTVTFPIHCYSDYPGAYEANYIMEQVANYFRSPLDLSSAGFRDFSDGGEPGTSFLEEQALGENVVIRHAMLSWVWKIADTKF